VLRDRIVGSSQQSVDSPGTLAPRGGAGAAALALRPARVVGSTGTLAPTPSGTPSGAPWVCTKGVAGSTGKASIMPGRPVCCQGGQDIGQWIAFTLSPVTLHPFTLVEYFRTAIIDFRRSRGYHHCIIQI
jgi:hypothetical protein